MILRAENDGPRTRATNDWGSDQGSAETPLLSCNAGEFRLLLLW